MDDLSASLKESLLSRGASLVGFADISALPPDSRHSLPYAVSIATALDASVIAGILNGPTPQYYAEMGRVNRLLVDLGRYSAGVLRKNGFAAISLEIQRKDIDWGILSVPLPVKTVATRAGLGWIGKCATLVTREYGNAVRLFTVLTDARLDVGTPIDVSHCADCEACVKACPAHAPSGKPWDVNMNRDDFYDAFACRKMAEESCAKIGIDARLCGICIAACPWTQQYLKKSKASVHFSH
jgi:epoxyqueuosine reductase